MTYRVTTEPANRANSGASRRRPDRSFSRNVTITGTALVCVCLIAAGVALTGREHSAGSLPNYVVSHKSARSALKIAWVEPEYQAQFERNPNIAANTAPAKADTPIKTASRFDAAFDQLSERVAAAAPTRPVPLPKARPRKIAVAAIEVPLVPLAPSPQPSPPEPGEEKLAAAAPATRIPAFPDKPEPSPAPSARQFQLMSYAPTREVIFDADITGSIGVAARDLVPPAITKGKPIHATVRAPARPKPHHKLTPQEKLWGPVRVASLTPAAAMPDSGGIPRAPYDRQTAVYVITDKKVYMPDGSVLEAHSGYGSKMDDPRFVKVRMRGATPPHVYDLKMREALFHGVEAIRMLPIGGEDAIFGRDGILAHTYMLGSTGQSNGCVSFRNYEPFLNAFKAGKITRLAVIARLD